MVVAGQQPGFLGGPLYTLYKALTAILARKIEAASGRPVVPIFWVASDDHDFEEVRRTWLIDGGVGAGADRVSGREAFPLGCRSGGFDSARRSARSWIASRRSCRASEFRDRVMGPLRAAYAPGRSWTEAFARFMAGLVTPLGALVFDASDPEAKALSLPVFEREVALMGASSKAAREKGEELDAPRLSRADRPRGQRAQLFWHQEAREAVRVAEDGTLRVGRRAGA